MKVFVVDAPIVNAFSSMGSIIVIYTGLIDRYIEQYNGDVRKVENVGSLCWLDCRLSRV